MWIYEYHMTPMEGVNHQDTFLCIHMPRSFNMIGVCRKYHCHLCLSLETPRQDLLRLALDQAILWDS